MNFTRNLRRGMSGADVKYIKDQLFSLGIYFEDKIKKISSSTFGSDTEEAVIKFQRKNVDSKGRQLEDDGIIGCLTWEAIEDQVEKKNKDTNPDKSSDPIDTNGLLNSYTHIAADKRRKIEADLANVDDLRRKIVLEALEYAYDKDVGGEVRALYMIGGNLYNSDLKLNIATVTKIQNGAKRSPSYYNGGRAEWMIKQVGKNPNLPASDCSGMEIGFMRKYGLIKANADATANGLCSSGYSKAITRAELKSGDWVGKDGHIGLYVGGGFVVEFYGGAYACQLTDVDRRRGYDFVRGRVTTGSAWTRFRRPLKY